MIDKYDLKTPIDWMEIPPFELARQLCILDYRLFKVTKIQEYYHANWTRDVDSATTNLNRARTHFSEVRDWVAGKVLEESAAGSVQKGKVISGFIRLMEYLRTLNNYNAVMQIFTALNSPAVAKLKKAWSSVPEKSITIYNNIAQLMNSKKNYHNYHEHLKKFDQTHPLSSITRPHCKR